MDALLTPEITIIAVALLVAFAIGGVLYAVFEPMLSGNNRRDAMVGQIASRKVVAAGRPGKDADKRRKNVQDQLKEFDDRQKAKQQKSKATLADRLEQAGLEWEKKHFIIFSVVCGLVAFVGLFLASGSILMAIGAGFVGAFGFPRFYLNRRKKKRLDQFIDELPNAVDIIVRGIKAGLPVGDCVKIVGNEAREPVSGEFRKIVEAQMLGLTLSESIQKLPERVPLPEASFFAIVVSIQQQSGGNLSEALGNLGRVLRSRKTLKGKIKALSSEAKSSAGIIGSLPFLVTTALSLIAPDYITVLFTETVGNIIIAGSLFWMFIGIMVMRNMINFDF